MLVNQLFKYKIESDHQENNLRKSSCVRIKTRVPVLQTFTRSFHSDFCDFHADFPFQSLIVPALKVDERKREREREREREK